jgi:hypothetical protein
MPSVNVQVTGSELLTSTAVNTVGSLIGAVSDAGMMVSDGARLSVSPHPGSDAPTKHHPRHQPRQQAVATINERIDISRLTRFESPQ